MVGSATQTVLRDRCSFPFRADLAGPHREQATRRIDVILLGEDCCLNEPLSEPRRAPSAGAVKWLPSARVLEHPIFHQHGCRTHPVVTCMHYKKFYDLLAKQSSTTQALRRIFATSVIRAEQSACLLLAHRQSYARKLLKPRQIHADVGECPAAAADGRDERSLVEHFCSETPVERPFSNTPSITVSDDMQGVRATSLSEDTNRSADPGVRVSAPCQHYPQCGGCTCQEVMYSAQLADKQHRVMSLFKRTAGMDLPYTVWQDIHPCQQQYRYRNKMCFTSDKNSLGLYLRDRKELLSIHDCHLQDGTANIILQQASSMELYLHIEALTIRWAQASRDASSRKYMAILHTRSAPLKKAAKMECLPAISMYVAVVSLHMHSLMATATLTLLPGALMQKHVQQKPPPRRLLAAAEQLCSHVPDLASVILRAGVTRHDWLNSSASETVLAGQPYLKQRLCSLQFKVSPASFFQTNPAQAEAMYSLVIAAAGLQPTDTALDLFCGIGTITLALAQRCKAVIGVEASPAAVADAKHNARANGIQNAAFWQADLSDATAVTVVASQLPSVDVIVADPARAGLDAAVQGLLFTCQARTIVYVSCNPATQARDTAALCKHGYRVQSVQPCDMFPHTAHVENIVVLSRDGS